MEERLMDTLEARRADTLGQDYLARARALRPLIAAAADEAERRRELTPEIVDALIENGIFRMLLPKSLGGAELDPLTYAAVLEELAQGDGSTAWCLGQNSGCSMIAPYLPADIAEEVFGGPRGILAWGPDLPGAGRTVAVEGGYRLTGRWGVATGSRHASWLGCHELLACLDGHREGRLRFLYRDRARQGAARRKRHAAPEQCDPVADRAMRGAAEIGARLSARRHRRDVGRGAGDRQDQPRASPAIASCRDLGDPPGARHCRDGLSRRRRLGDFRSKPARTPHARHPCRDAAGSGPRRAFRDGRPDAVGPAARRPHVPLAPSLSGCAASPRSTENRGRAGRGSGSRSAP